MGELSMALAVGAIVAVILYLQIQKLTAKIDEQASKFGEEASEFGVDDSVARLSHISSFCEAVESEISALQALARDDEYCLPNKADELREYLALCAKKLVFLSTTHSNSQRLNEQIASMLMQLDDKIRECVKDGENEADALRDRLANKFKG